ncbi:hypothetical protein [Maricaulis sp.]|uniref:hypothetical protein n=1 Tax=Maricaulis sp. TaxID=1486257 RepID=UPI00260AAA93|nr:hypothetical protein [Maricaulis sp.]
MAQYQWTFLPDANVVELTTAGRITVAGLYHSMSELPNDPRWRSDTQLLASFGFDTALTSILPTELIAYGDTFKAWNRAHRVSAHPRTAIVCHAALALFVASLWSALNPKDWMVETRVMSSREKALAWLTEPLPAKQAHPEGVD